MISVHMTGKRMATRLVSEHLAPLGVYAGALRSSVVPRVHRRKHRAERGDRLSVACQSYE